MDGLLRLMAELQELAYNPELRSWEWVQPNNVAGKGRIEKPGEAKNIIWQNRASAPTAYENALADALEKALGGGAETLAQIVDAINAASLRAPDGSAWTDASFAAELRRLGA
jgi:hypothetical protein